ncbi:MAG: HsdR family type I site-specific deoxyribonuclease [Spirochaetes bacterium]|nr:HsdR family type I site-specific deoxyribonuclease [Spirochaetota bacterium]
MSAVGQIERATQNRIVRLFRERLDYEYLGDWTDRVGNSCVEDELLKRWLDSRGVSDALAKRAIRALHKAADDRSATLTNRNRSVYELLRYGVKLSPAMGEQHETIWLIDWKSPESNHFAIAEEVTVEGARLSDGGKASAKRPDIVLYVNGIALGALELKRSIVSVLEGIRQNLDNQKREFIQPFFSTMQWIMAGNDTEGLRYGTIETPEKYYLRWLETEGEFASEPKLLDRHLLQLCNKARFLELIHYFVVFDSGVKKICRQNQYFGVKASQEFIRRREGGIIWHTQGSGKTLTMVWLAKWILENRPEGRVLIVTDRKELDEQVERVFMGVNLKIYRSTSGADLIDKLNTSTESLLCSLVHKFGDRMNGRRTSGVENEEFLEALRKLPPGFRAKGDIHVFVDECHRTQSGDLHKAMKKILPDSIFIGFTGTPLLRDNKQRSVEVFGRYIHTYKFDQAVREGVVLDLRYEARDIDQSITSQSKIDAWFDAKTKGLNDLAKAQLKKKWGTMQTVFSSRSRLEKIVADILLDMNTKPRLADGHGNAMLVAGSIYEACKYYALFSSTELSGHCAVVTSYAPDISDTKGETTGEGDTDNIFKYDIYRKMLASWFDEPETTAVRKVEEFEKQAKKAFIEEPGRMKLLIVVDKLLTGFDAPPATYLYIDKEMRDHGLFQAICRVNRLDGESKDYGYIVDYKDLFKSLEGAVADYTSGAFDAYDSEDVAGLLKDRLKQAKADLEAARETVKGLCEPVAPPGDSHDYLRYFCSEISGDIDRLAANEPKRLKLYTFTATLIRCFANMASEMAEAGYSATEIAAIKHEVDHFAKVRDEVKLASGDYIDLKAYEPDMRYLIDHYISADESAKISSFDDLGLVDLLVDRGAAAVDSLPKRLKDDREAVAETIENNVRRLIVKQFPIDPNYYEKMSRLLDALIDERRKEVLDYIHYLDKIAELARNAAKPETSKAAYPSSLSTSGKRALYNNLGGDESLALAVDAAVRDNLMDGYRSSAIKPRNLDIFSWHPPIRRPSRNPPSIS